MLFDPLHRNYLHRRLTRYLQRKTRELLRLPRRRAHRELLEALIQPVILQVPQLAEGHILHQQEEQRQQIQARLEEQPRLADRDRPSRDEALLLLDFHQAEGAAASTYQVATPSYNLQQSAEEQPDARAAPLDAASPEDGPLDLSQYLEDIYPQEAPLEDNLFPEIHPWEINQ